MKKILAACLALIILGAACSGNGIGGQDASDDRTVDLGRPGDITLASALTRFDACSDFLGHM